MSSPQVLQCLFCNHLNPADASFCNKCGSQLHLRPCDNCGAIEKRTATNCYKCNAELTLPEIPKLATGLGGYEDGAKFATHNVNSASAILDTQVSDPDLNNSRMPKDHTSLPESAAQLLSGFSQGLPREDRAISDREVALATVEASLQNHDIDHLYAVPHQDDETVTSEGDSATTGSRRIWRVSMSTLLLVAIAVSIYSAIAMSLYYYKEQFAQLSENQDIKPLAPSVFNEPVSGSLTPSAVTTPIASASAPADKTPKHAANTEVVEKTLSLAPSGAGTATTVRASPAIDEKVKPRPNRPIFSECTEAVAALGLCSSITKEGNQ
ncbi:zinc ribbon domain-containing protein [Propionivibrio sp.]|uniref:zinc ribbon domain-containing protein n=1 Tax=Propionivibrio sp. TaxID=2212460 RepID=UPI003BF2EAC3